MNRLTLIPQERIIFQTKPHILILLYEISLIAAVILVSSLVLSDFETFWISINSVLLFVLSFAGAVLFLDWWSTRFSLTNIRIVRVSGIIGKDSLSIRLEKIQDISYRFGILGRIFGFGDLVIESARSFGKISFKHIPSPWRVRARVQESIQKRRNSNSSWQEE